MNVLRLKTFRNTPLHRKLTIVIMLTSCFSVLLGCATFLVFDLAQFRAEMARERVTIAKIISAKIATALINNDRVMAGQTLSPLRDDPLVVDASIFLLDGTVLAKYERVGAKMNSQFPKKLRDTHWFEDGQLFVVHKITEAGKTVGILKLRYDEPRLNDRIRQFAGIALVVILASSAAAFAISLRLQRLVSDPISSLTRVASIIKEQKDYSIRASKNGHGEFDLLIDAFNQMLTQIHEREQQLHKAKDELEKRVQARTYALQQELSERKRTEEQLRQSQKMEAVGRLAGGVAHDFNNILTVITGYSDLILRKLGEGHPLYKKAEEIQTAAQRAASLTRQLLAFSRKQVLQPKVLDLNMVVASMEKMLRRLIGEDMELHTSLAPNLGKVKIDPGQIEQVIMNLVVNARDAMPKGGSIRIETSSVTIENGTLFQDGEMDPKEYSTISITDTGLGMSPEVQSHLFEPFFTTKGKDKGTGLGLPTSYGIVKQSGGHINVYSEEGKGTTFKIFLPRVEKAAEALARHDEAKLLPQGKETVLLVEDEPTVRELAACVLRESGYRVMEACNGKEALRVAEENNGSDIHLLVSDVIMPQMGGKELLDCIRVARPKTKVLFISGYTDDAIVHRGVLEPGVAFLEKPFSPALLVHKVREVLDRPVATAV